MPTLDLGLSRFVPESDGLRLLTLVLCDFGVNFLGLRVGRSQILGGAPRRFVSWTSELGLQAPREAKRLPKARPPASRANDTETIRSLLLLVGALNGGFGRTRIASLASGTDDEERFDDLPERGSLRGWSPQHIMDLLRALEGAGLVEASRGEYPTMSTTRKCDQVAVGRLDPNDLGLQMPTFTKKSRSRKRKR